MGPDWLKSECGEKKYLMVSPLTFLALDNVCKDSWSVSREARAQIWKREVMIMR